METHRSAAVHLYLEALGEPLNRNHGVAFLDTALILMCLDVSFVVVPLKRFFN
jgi:hypothetical protein